MGDIYETGVIQVAGHIYKYRRGKLGVTQQEAARSIGISRRSLSNYERGYSRIPLTIALKLDKLYGCDCEKGLSADIEADSRSSNIS